MKNIKKLLAFLLALTLTAGLAACGDSGQTAQESGNASNVSESQPQSEPESMESAAATPKPESGTPEPAESVGESESLEAQGGDDASQPAEDASPEVETAGAGESLAMDIPKETAYTSGVTLVTGYSDESVYDLEFTDGVLSTAYYEDDEGKGGWGGDSGLSIENCTFYGMTVEEAAAALESMNYRVEIH